MEVSKATIDIELRLIEQEMVELKEQMTSVVRTMRDSVEDAADQLSAATQGLKNSAEIAQHLRVLAGQAQDVPAQINYTPISATTRWVPEGAPRWSGHYKEGGK